MKRRKAGLLGLALALLATLALVLAPAAPARADETDNPQGGTDITEWYAYCDQSEFVYDGVSHAPTVDQVHVQNDEGAELVPRNDFMILEYRDQDWNVLAEAPSAAGGYWVVVQGVGSYQGQTSIWFQIVDPKDLSSARIYVYDPFVSTGQPIDFSIRVFAYDDTPIDEDAYRLEFFTSDDVPLDDAPTEAGEYKVRAVALDGSGYTGSVDSATFNILSQNDLSVASVDMCHYRVAYTGELVDPGVTVTAYDGTPLKEGTDYELTYYVYVDGERVEQEPRQIGVYEVEVTPAEGSKYTGRNLRCIEIVDPNDLSEASIDMSSFFFTYTGKPIEPVITVTSFDGKVLEEGTHYKLTWYEADEETALDGAPIEKGTYYVRAEAIGGGFTGATEMHQGFAKVVGAESLFNATIKINKAELAYTGEPVEPVVTVTAADGTELVEGQDYYLVYDDFVCAIDMPIDVGDYEVHAVAIDGSGYEDVTDVCNFSIVEAVEPGPDQPGPAAGIPMHRLYNPNSGEHFYTANAAERDNLVSLGWNYEGVGWTAPKTSSTPVYRLYNPYAGEHHYTTSAGERDALVRVGWNDEGIGWFSDDAKTTPLYRQYNPNQYACNHNYTTSKSENDWLVGLGWQAEGIGWYGM